MPDEKELAERKKDEAAIRYLEEPCDPEDDDEPTKSHDASWRLLERFAPTLAALKRAEAERDAQRVRADAAEARIVELKKPQ